MNNLFAMFKSNNRYGLLTSIIAKNGQPILLVIEIGAGLIGDLNANINKFVTMYQIKDLKQKLNSINKDDFLYLNNSLKSIINKKPLN